MLVRRKNGPGQKSGQTLSLKYAFILSAEPHHFKINTAEQIPKTLPNRWMFLVLPATVLSECVAQKKHRKILRCFSKTLAPKV